MKSQRLRKLVAFDEPVESLDSKGGTTDGWAEKYRCHADFIYSRGSEAVDAARLEGRSIYKVKIRQSKAARSIKMSWRMRDVRRETEFNIREFDDETDVLWIYLVVESGVAV